MAKQDLLRRLEEAFARLNVGIDAAEDKLLARQTTGPGVLSSELAQARAMLDVCARRLTAVPAGERADLDPELAELRSRWDTAQKAYEAAEGTVGGRRAEYEAQSRGALEEVQDGLLLLVSQMNTRFAGHPPGATP
jgi:hypothetical protein